MGSESILTRKYWSEKVSNSGIRFYRLFYMKVIETPTDVQQIVSMLYGSKDGKIIILLLKSLGNFISWVQSPF